uniref:Sulfotransferase n=1 Tax=Plectus sambesii TaxID=2011161 RepID=A0A914UUR0_9BILA
MLRPTSVWADLAFLFVRVVIHTVSDIIGLLCGRQRRQPGSVEVLRILARHKTDFSDDENFIYWHESNQPSSILLQPNWFVSKMTAKYAYFALLPTTIENLEANAVPFLWITFFQKAIKHARMPIGEFCEFGRPIGPPKGRVTFIHNVPRCGSTLLCKMLQVPSKNVIVLSEIEAICMLTYRKWNGKRNWDEDFVNRQLLPAVLNSICKNMTKSQLYIIKNQPHSVRQIEQLRHSFPEVCHLFMFRRDIEANMRSVIRLMSTNEGGWDRRLFDKLFFWCPAVCEALCVVGWFRTEMRFIQQINPRNISETAAIVVGSVFAQYEESKGHNDLVVFYEDLVEQPKECMITLFKYCGIPLEMVDSAVDAMNDGDSQAGTWLSSAELKKIPVEVTEADMARFRQIWKQISANVDHVLNQK